MSYRIIGIFSQNINLHFLIIHPSVRRKTSEFQVKCGIVRPQIAVCTLALDLEFRRFSSDTWVNYQKMQIEDVYKRQVCRRTLYVR